MARNIRVNQSHFAMIPQANIRRSVFDRSHVYKTTFNEGQLIPYFVDEVIPGDTFTLNPVEFCRLATPVVPFMDNIYIESFFFFVPSRLVYDKWVNLCGEQENPEDSTDYLVPTVSLSGDMTNKIPDYMGIACASGSFNNISVNCLPFRAYWLIWNEWFRDENLQKSVKVSKGETNTVLEPMGQSTANPNYGLPSGIKNWYEPAPRGKRYDYFCGALPWPQKGEAVDLPLTGNAPISLSSDGPMTFSLGSSTRNISASTLYSAGKTDGLAGDTLSLVAFLPKTSGYLNTDDWDDQRLPSPASYKSGLSAVADLSSISAVTINSLRQAFMLQRYYEIDARGGTRYTEKLQAHFGVTNPDARLQRPEFLGSHSSMMNINPVTQTSSTDSTTPQGNLAAFGLNAQRYHAFTKSFSEFGYIIGLINVRADLTYQQGVNKMWLRSDVLDFYWPSFAHLGEQTIQNIEIYCQGNDDDKKVFGYQERYAEYRYKPSLITGQFRSTYKEPLDVWHLSQKFASLPTLSDEFIQDHPPISRVVAVPSYPHFLLDVKFNLKCIRPMPMFGIPGMMGHF
ncbi:MAG: major capsid protein [Phascolarctobacterium sp.]|nr:major capsid protein [Phascolarctobacterium sp.]